MQFVRTTDLKPGMRLAKPIYNKMGVLLYERDTKLTIQGINSIENFGLIGIFILEPAEPVPPLSQEDIEFEQFQTIYMFRLKDCMDRLNARKAVPALTELTTGIYQRYGTLDHKLNFTQNLRSSADFVYKHAISAAILSAMLANELQIPQEDTLSLISAAALYDFGYLYVPQKILEKGNGLEPGDKDYIQLSLERGFDMIRPESPALGLSSLALEILQQIIFRQSRTVTLKEASPEVKLLCDILIVADKFDRLTAMNINQPPVSELIAMNYLDKHPETYNPKVVSALANCIHILPTGACLDFSNGQKGLVIQENPVDYLHPIILNFKDNQLYDLSIPEVRRKLRIVDIMKTMDNRIKIDEEALQHFVADENIKATMEHFRKKRIKLEQLQKQRELKKAAEEFARRRR